MSSVQESGSGAPKDLLLLDSGAENLDYEVIVHKVVESREVTDHGV